MTAGLEASHPTLANLKARATLAEGRPARLNPVTVDWHRSSTATGGSNLRLARDSVEHDGSGQASEPAQALPHG